MASITDSGSCVPAGPSKKPDPVRSAGKCCRARWMSSVAAVTSWSRCAGAGLRHDRVRGDLDLHRRQRELRDSDDGPEGLMIGAVPTEFLDHRPEHRLVE